MLKRVIKHKGFVIPSAIFLIVILALLAAFMVQISNMQHTSSAQDIQGSRTYHVARAGIDWAMYQVLDPRNLTVVLPTNSAWPNMPACRNLNTTIEQINLVVTCNVVGDFIENAGNRSIRVYALTATASRGVVGSAHYVERVSNAIVSLCRRTDGAAPAFRC